MHLIKPSIGRGCVLFLLLLVLLYSLLIPPASAAESDPVDLGVVELTGTVSGGKFTLSPNIIEDLFDLDAIYPGGSWKRTVHVTNAASRPMEVAVISCTPKPDTQTALFDALTVEVSADGDLLYAGPYGAGSEDDPMTDALKVDGNSFLDLEITMHLAADAGNALQGASMASVWEFGANYRQPSNKETTYTVYYVDEAGTQLHKKKVAETTIGTTVTEKALKIDGYRPDAAEKSILAKQTAGENIITFVYSRKAVDLTTSPDKPDGVRTGVELDEDRSTMIYILAVFLLLCSLLVGVIIRKLVQKESNCNREEELHNGK